MRNKVELLGNVGNDPEIKTFDNGNKIANFSLATTEKWKDKQTGEKKEHTEWHKVVVNGKLVDVVEKYVKKGDRLMIDGKIKTRSYEDKNKENRYITEVICSDLLMLSNKSDNTNSQPAAETFVAEGDDDLPF